MPQAFNQRLSQGTPPLGDLNAWQPCLSNLAAWNGRLWTAGAAAYGENMNFLQKRAQTDFRLMQKLMACRSPFDAWTTVADFWMATAKDYSERIASSTGSFSEAAAERANLDTATTESQKLAA